MNRKPDSSGSNRRAQSQPLFEGEYYIGPDGTEYFETPEEFLKDSRTQQLGLAGASLCILTSTDHPEDMTGELQLKWVEPDVVQEAAHRGLPILRRKSLVSLYASMDGDLLLAVIGDGLLWPPISSTKS